MEVSFFSFEFFQLLEWVPVCLEFNTKSVSQSDLGDCGLGLFITLSCFLSRILRLMIRTGLDILDIPYKFCPTIVNKSVLRNKISHLGHKTLFFRGYSFSLDWEIVVNFYKKEGLPLNNDHLPVYDNDKLIIHLIHTYHISFVHHLYDGDGRNVKSYHKRRYLGFLITKL